jgi:uncharacterized membrane protein
MKIEPIVHEVPFPIFMRVIMCAIGSVPLVMGPYELWRGVWPINVTTPFFGLMIVASLMAAAVMIGTGLFKPNSRLTFSPGLMVVEERFPFNSRISKVVNSEIVSIAPLRVEQMEDGDVWPVEITLKSGKRFNSLRFDSEATAKKHADEFKQALGI